MLLLTLVRPTLWISPRAFMVVTPKQLSYIQEFWHEMTLLVFDLKSEIQVFHHRNHAAASCQFGCSDLVGRSLLLLPWHWVFAEIMLPGTGALLYI